MKKNHVPSQPMTEFDQRVISIFPMASGEEISADSRDPLSLRFPRDNTIVTTVIFTFCPV